MSVILDAHVSRWNTSGSVPPLLPLGLIVHVAAAQSVAQVKVYLPTLKLLTACRCVHHTRVQRPGAARTAVRCDGPKCNEHCEERARRTRSGRRRRRCKQRPLRCMRGGEPDGGGVEHRVCDTRRCNVRRCIAPRTSTHGVAHCAHHAARVATCNVQHAVLRPATRSALQPAARQPATCGHPGYKPAAICVAACNTSCCRM